MIVSSGFLNCGIIVAYLWPLVWPVAIRCIHDHAPEFDVNWQIIDWTALTERQGSQGRQRLCRWVFFEKGEFSSYAEGAAPWP
jgi:hypothetical protein